MLFSSPAYAQAAGAPAGPGLFESLAPLILIVVIFWFLILRPQNKKMKEHREMVNNVRRGDTVVTAGGLVGKVAKVKDDDAEIEVDFGEGIRMRVIKSTLSDVRVKGEPAKKDDK
ncbi:MAG: preprotein translocase subunit YajC [Kordiimonadaceae bacterium]|nr:preprotein translocase subunit YajC [Kordiimonadaceae bacterium]MBO6570608.1 preprotein translocase subunit YajC [Kordiimonadaceae bacterium]MBO6966534.1 preprotein translocase subunit YajC [Kordiimonadaceae bacterium]